MKSCARILSSIFNRRLWVRVGALALISVSIAYNSPRAEEAVQCKNLYKLAYLKKATKTKVAPAAEKRIEEFVVHGEDTLPRETSYRGMDIDKDGKEDSVIRSCGSSIIMMCSLLINLSSGGEFSDVDTEPFYIARLGGKIYMVKEPYSNKEAIISQDQLQKKEADRIRNLPDIDIFSINETGIHQICH